MSLYSQLNQEKVILREYPVATAESNFSANIFYTLQSMQAEEVSNKLLFESAEKNVIQNYLYLTIYHIG